MCGSKMAAGKKNKTLQLQRSHDEVEIEGQAIYCAADEGNSLL
jgi:hypothetical protein